MSLFLSIFWVFFKIGAMSFGGIFATLPQLEQIVVGEMGWITHDQFMQSFVIGQFVPGPNVAMCPLIGYWVNGWSGFFAAFLGIYSGPIVIVSAATVLYKRHRSTEWVRRSEIALRPMVLGLVTASVVRLWWSQSNPGDHAVVFRTVSAIMSVGAIYLISAKNVSSMKITIGFGIMWWLANWSLPLML